MHGISSLDFMCSLFRNKYRSESDRLQGYNYTLAGAYYITIVTKDRIQYFGSITKGEIILTDLGSMLLEFAWQNRYYDHIIRSDIELHKIRNYIINNPAKLIGNFKSEKHDQS